MRKLLTPPPLTIEVPAIARECGLTDESIIEMQQGVLRVLRYQGWEVEEIPVEDDFSYFEEPILSRTYVIPVPHSEAYTLDRIAMAFDLDADSEACEIGGPRPFCGCFSVSLKGQKEDPPPTLSETLEAIRGSLDYIRKNIACIEERLAAIESTP